MHYPITRKTSGIWLVRIPIFLHFFIAAVQFRKNNVKSKANIKIILKMFNLSLEKLTFAFFVFLIKLFLRISSKEDTWLWKMLSFHKNPPFILEIFNCKYFLLPLFFPLLATVEFTEEAGWRYNLKVYDAIMSPNWNLKLFNILRRKEGMILKLRQFIEYYKRKIFMVKYAKMWTRN